MPVRILLLVFAAILAAPLDASMDDFRTLPGESPAALFPDPPARQVSVLSTDSFDSFARGQLLAPHGPDSRDLLFGTGGSLGVAGNPVGIGFQFWFDVYLAPFLAVGFQNVTAYGIITREHEEGGTAVSNGFAMGAKLVLDLPDVEFSRWCRPFVAFYPVGFLYFVAEEEFETNGSTDRIIYDDLFYLMQGGAGVDFFLTPHLALGVGLYLWGTIGGSTHREDDVTIRTQGAVGVYFEYIRLSVRF